MLPVTFYLPREMEQDSILKNEGFLTGQIENPPPHLVIGSPREVEEAHQTDILSRISKVRLSGEHFPYN